jgi:hypothetical protein
MFSTDLYRVSIHNIHTDKRYEAEFLEEDPALEMAEFNFLLGSEVVVYKNDEVWCEYEQ